MRTSWGLVTMSCCQLCLSQNGDRADEKEYECFHEGTTVSAPPVFVAKKVLVSFSGID